MRPKFNIIRNTYLLSNQMPRFIILTILKAFLEPVGCLEQFATDIYILIEPVHKILLLIPWPLTNGGSDKPALANIQTRQRLLISFGSYKYSILVKMEDSDQNLDL